MKITVVRFNNPIAIGKELDMNSHLSDGASILGNPIALSKYDSTFLRVDFLGAKKYSQFIPWAQVSTVLFEESKNDKSSTKGN